MKRSLILIGLLLTSSSFLTFAQSNLKKGYIVTNSNDTLKGFINYKEQRKNPNSVDFRSASTNKGQVYTIKDCTGYGIEGEESFRRFAVNVSLSEIDVANLSVEPNLSAKRDTVFLKILQDGKNVSLFSYRDDIKERFYLLEKDNVEPQELIRQLYLKDYNSKTIIIGNKYVRQLLKPLKEFNASKLVDENKLLNLEYDERSLLRVVSEINEEKQLAKQKYAAGHFFIGGGLSISKATYGGNNDLASSLAETKNAYSPMLTAGFDLFFNPAIGRLIFRTELSFLTSKNEVSVKTDELYKSFLSHSFNQLTFVVTPQFIYNIYHTDGLKCFAGLGAGLNFSKTSNNKSVRINAFSQTTIVTDNEVVPEQFNFSGQLLAGVVLNKQIEISAGYSPSAAITNYANFNVSMQRFRIGANYFFGK